MHVTVSLRGSDRFLEFSGTAGDMSDCSEGLKYCELQTYNDLQLFISLC